MSNDTKEILERRLGLALDFQGSLAAELKQMRAWRNKWRARTQEWREKAHEAAAAIRALRSELGQANASLCSAHAQAQRVENALRAQVEAAKHADACDLRTQLDAAQQDTKRAQGETLAALQQRDAATKRALEAYARQHGQLGMLPAWVADPQQRPIHLRPFQT